MKILSIETSHGICSVALSANDRIVCAKTDSEPSRQAERLFITIENMMNEVGISYSDIDAVAADIGPGSFTGIRIGLAAARGIALAAKIPVIGVNGFEALAQQAKFEDGFENILVTLDARRGQVFTQYFCNGVASTQALLSYSEVPLLISGQKNVAIIGDGAPFFAEYSEDASVSSCILDKHLLPDASMIAMCAFKKFSAGDYDKNPAPLYIRPPDAKLPANAAAKQSQ